MNLVFTSAGDNTRFHELWPGEHYDIYVIYYGESDENYEKYKLISKFIEKRKGSKFQNFWYFYFKYPEIISKYSRFFILDDDIVISPPDISRMFQISREHSLDICQPSFSDKGVISHSVTKHNPGLLLQYTNFCEVNTPLFSKEALDSLMKVLDPKLIGWGIDYLFIWANGLDREDAYAVIHMVQCVNPHKNTKGGRELYKIPGARFRRRIWEEYAKRINCPTKFRKRRYNAKTGELV
jgi:hypothetical protein